ncbi:FAD-binding-3 domain-containing protein [Mycena indigotica]|uniref:FAD-binding-3 domain-containing protein n=1 Tax=Mycena indigotica TaxID=2126181 RepID=A0A8H6VTK3_9AGAR|nr:FAD-binding-3 domain-containing protein [Mycena indigotica]KAF7293432.1 FAD-binding-3 domain-containing protein [Mycena indigotica]
MSIPLSAECQRRLIPSPSSSHPFRPVDLMPKAPWELPAGVFEISSDGAQVRCLVCRKEGKRNVGGWIQMKNARRHLTAPLHVQAMEICQSRVIDSRTEVAHLHEPYAAPAFNNYQPNATISAVRDEQLAMFSPFAKEEANVMQLNGDPVELQRLVDLRADELAGEEAMLEQEVLGVEECVREAYVRLLMEAMEQGSCDDGGDNEEAKTGDISDDGDSEDDLSLEIQPGRYFPYPNKPNMLLDLMDNLPRCRFSSAQMSVILQFARALGAPDIPTLKGLRKMQQLLQKTVSSEPQRVQSSMGNVFYINDIRATISRDFANPVVAPHIHLFPEDVAPGSPISEIWQAERWKEYEPKQLTPMFSRGQRRFWVEEIAERSNGSFVLLRSLIIHDGVLCTDAQAVTHDNTTALWHYDENTPIETFPVDELTRDFTEILFLWGNKPLQWSPTSSSTPTMPNPLRAKVADDEDLVVIMVDIFLDVLRTAAQTRNRLEAQLTLATRGDAKSIKEQQTLTGTKDKLAQHWIERTLVEFSRLKEDNPRLGIDALAGLTQQWLDAQPGDKINPLLDIAGLDPCQDTPVELLHTVLLGVMKYIWHFMNTKQWSDSDRCLLAIRLQSTDTSSLTIPPIRAAYIVQYRNSLIGKHFKTLMQTLAFCSHDICTAEQRRLIKTAGDLGARLWIPEIDDMDAYLEDLRTAIANLLDAFDAVDPLRILIKIKLHLLAHIPDDIRRFGPAIRFATEVFESCNAIFRACSVRSNRLSPSRDIAAKFASIERVRHILCGGYWLDVQQGAWVQAGEDVLRVLRDDPVFQRHLGWTPPKPIVGGQTRLASEKKQPPIRWAETRAAALSGTNTIDCQPDLESEWRYARTIVAQNGDILRPGSWAYVLDGGKWLLGRVVEILVNSDARVLVTLEQFICTEKLHADLGWPVVRRPRGEDITENNVRSVLVVSPGVLRFMCSVQHDCRRGRCSPVVSGRERQEREETTREKSLIQHGDDDFFVLNLSSLHNFVHLRRILPRSLTTLKPIYPDRDLFHNEMAAKAQQLRLTNREKTAQRRRVKAAEKKRRAVVAVTEADEEVVAAEMGQPVEGEELESDLVDPDELVNGVRSDEGEDDEDDVPFVDDEDDADYAGSTAVGEWSGINALLYYGPTLVKSIGLKGATTSLIVSGGIGIVQFIAVGPAVIYIDRVGRKPLLRACLHMAVSHLIIAVLVMQFQSDWSSHAIAAWAAVAAIYTFTFAYGVSFGPIGWVLPSEVFPLSMRGRGVALSTASNWSNNFFIGLVTPIMMEYSPVGTFLTFATACFVAYLWATYTVPETAGVTLEDMDRVFGGDAGREDRVRRRELEEEMGLRAMVMQLARNNGL